MSGAVLGAGEVSAIRPSRSLPRWAGVEGAGREHGQHCQERASRGQPDWSGDSEVISRWRVQLWTYAESKTLETFGADVQGEEPWLWAQMWAEALVGCGVARVLRERVG